MSDVAPRPSGAGGGVTTDSPEYIPPPEKFWVEEVRRGASEVLIIMFGADARGSIEMKSYEEKVAWIKAMDILNSTLELS